MKDKIINLLTWIVVIPLIPYIFIRGIPILIKSIKSGKTADEIAEEWTKAIHS